MSDKSNSVIILRSYWESIKDLPDDKQLLFLKTIIEYGMDNIEPEFTGMEKSFWIQIKTTIDSSIKRYNASVENGKKGGAPKGNNNAKKQPETTQEQPKSTQEQPETRVTVARVSFATTSDCPDTANVLNAGSSFPGVHERTNKRPVFACDRVTIATGIAGTPAVLESSPAVPEAYRIVPIA